MPRRSRQILFAAGPTLRRDRLHAVVVGVACCLAISAVAAGQGPSSFGPPPVPSLRENAGEAPVSRVRGIADPGQSPRGPSSPAGADEAPPATFVAPSQGSSGIGPTDGNADSARTVIDDAKLQQIEGGEILARVDGQVILASDMLWQINEMLAMSTRPIPPEKVGEVRRMLIQRQIMGLIETKLIYADFRRTVPSDNLPKIEENLVKPFEEVEIPRLEKIMKVDGREQLEARLKQSGTSLKDIQRQFNEKMIAGEWLKQNVSKTKTITYEDMLAYYQDHLKEYEYPTQVKWEELMVRLDHFHGDRNAAWQALCQMGNEVYAKAAANPGVRGPVFTDLAKAKSQGFTAAKGGQYDWTTLGALKCEAINNALTTLQVGQLSDGIESDTGFHIVRVLERREAGRTPFTEAQAKIRETLEGEQKQAALDAELVKLRKSAKVWTVFDGDMSGDRLAEALTDDKPRR